MNHDEKKKLAINVAEEYVKKTDLEKAFILGFMVKTVLEKEIKNDIVSA
jgi:hypothetical protein